MSLHLWLAFLAASIVISLTPGPGAVLSMSTGLRYGVAGALRAIAGLQLALVIQLAVVLAGVGAVLAASETAFLIVKFAGAGYLIWLGVGKWRSPVRALESDAAPPFRRLFGQGLLVNLTNPKAIVFMAALVPQFIDPAAPAAGQFAVLTATMTTVDVLVMAAYAGTAARCRRWLADPQAQRLQNRLFGGVFCAAGALLAASSRA